MKPCGCTSLAVVSIQLMSPASGDPGYIESLLVLNIGFHSINVPSEWGHGEGMFQGYDYGHEFPFN